MILSDKHIREAIAVGKIKVKPEIEPSQLGPCSLDLRLGNVFQVFEYSLHPYIDSRSQDSISEYMRKIEIEEGQPFIMQPRGFVLASTIEWIELDNNLMGRLEGRSSLARLGIIVHSTAGRVDPGWAGNITIELGNLGAMPIALYPGMRICALKFEKISSLVEMPYKTKPGNKYAGQIGPIASKISEDGDIF
jgi:dCTP deaminase